MTYIHGESEKVFIARQHTDKRKKGCIVLLMSYGTHLGDNNMKLEQRVTMMERQTVAQTIYHIVLGCRRETARYYELSTTRKDSTYL